MKLRTATLLALVGVAIHLCWGLFQRVQGPKLPEAAPSYLRYSAIPAICFETSLLVFFGALFHLHARAAALGSGTGVERNP